MVATAAAAPMTMVASSAETERWIAPSNIRLPLLRASRVEQRLALEQVRCRLVVGRRCRRKERERPCPTAGASLTLPAGVVRDRRNLRRREFGWTLTDGAESFFMGGGRRRYDDGKIQNIYIPKDEAKMKLYTVRISRSLGRTLLDYRRGRHAVERAGLISGTRSSPGRAASRLPKRMPAPTACRCAG